MRLILARHGQTDWNEERRIQGRTDLDLNEKGRAQAEMLAQALKEETVHAIYSSPLTRARDTAAAIARFHGAQVTVLDGLQEIDAGEVDGLTYLEMWEQHNEFLRQWIDDCSSIAPPGGCSLPELQEEVWGAIQHIVRKHSGGPAHKGIGGSQTVIAVAHFFPIVITVSKVLGIPLSECRRLRMDVASITTLEFDTRINVLISWNDTCHLRR
jgi:broad specificity phosphatase PhoE